MGSHTVLFGHRNGYIEAMHIAELLSMSSSQEAYRLLPQDMGRLVRVVVVHNLISEAMNLAGKEHGKGWCV